MAFATFCVFSNSQHGQTSEDGSEKLIIEAGASVPLPSDYQASSHESKFLLYSF